MKRSEWAAVLGLAGILSACSAEEDDPAEPAEAERVWEAVEGYQSWETVSHRGEIQIYTEDLDAIDGQDLTNVVEPGTFVVCEQSSHGTVDILEIFEKLDADSGWRGARFTAEGVHIPDTFRAVAFQCGNCHLGGGAARRP